MANGWFQFKQFKIFQDKCGMKVSTDACIQGALAARYLNKQPGLRYVLDIGTGTGLLSLMLAQKHQNLIIDAIEIEESAYVQAKENFASSKWNDRITAIHTSLHDWIEENTNTCYDFIICNPPFFQDHLQSVKMQRNWARHSITLGAEALVAAAGKLLKKHGTLCLLYPQSGWGHIASSALNHGLFLEKSVNIHPKTGLKHNRVIAFFSKQDLLQCKGEKLVIYEREKEYTQTFKELLKDYYLYL